MTDRFDVLAPVLADFEATCPGVVTLVGDYLHDGTGGTTGLPSGDSGLPFVEQVAECADHLQEQVFCEAVWGAWPECPDHVSSHPLAATVHDGQAWWVCPRTERPVARIGRLGT